MNCDEANVKDKQFSTHDFSDDDVVDVLELSRACSKHQGDNDSVIDVDFERCLDEGFSISSAMLSNPIAKGLFSNAVQSIRMGIEDFISAETSDSARYISSSRNLYAGALLLLKSYLAIKSCNEGYKLLRCEKDLKKLMKQHGKDYSKWTDIVESNTVGFGEMFLKLKECADVDKTKILSLHNFRDHIEHTYDFDNHDSIDKANMIKSAVELIYHFFCHPLRMSLADYFSDEICHKIKGIKSCPHALLEQQEKHFDSLQWMFPEYHEAFRDLFQCPKCGYDICDVKVSSLDAKADGAVFYCAKCKSEYTFGAVEEVVSNHCYCSVCHETIPAGELPTFLEWGMCEYHHHIWEKEGLLKEE